jgi:hypothetical protein
MTTNAFSDADVTYIRDNYFSLEELCAGRTESTEAVERLIRDRLLPAPAYLLDDGVEMFPADYFVLADQAGGVERLRQHFDSRHRTAGGDSADLDEDWDGYLSGVYSVCLRHVSPETMIRKTQLVASLTELLDDPSPDSSDWRARLRRQVWELDQLERDFSPDYDRLGRFAEPPSRDRLIVEARKRYPDVFAAAVSVA